MIENIIKMRDSIDSVLRNLFSNTNFKIAFCMFGIIFVSIGGIVSIKIYKHNKKEWKNMWGKSIIATIISIILGILLKHLYFKYVG